ncbi:uncharacterized protein L969DRAFT_54050 [Mixia osmundae IAM 14324]|uniref:RRM domain-containing protein n=1 Tax=Mixia osmundae (strain CBS 9802 / IAM 14324 / JCM 22182 / KY 12970) TaxID=764103 RepID=G7E273_MIXOS|nr:uncharacterized protein L969DRAFT_54050 [Mixia osmundae IAM 14324]KEI36805.1 hypothetical protein L969DRAFT_54050 [Mixia osmundae IAM 14324]GAA96933.1 hypothetical protein E5Q_03607 [Mixia osmundae IAM 14324]
MLNCTCRSYRQAARASTSATVPASSIPARVERAIQSAEPRRQHNVIMLDRLSPTMTPRDLRKRVYQDGLTESMLLSVHMVPDRELEATGRAILVFNQPKEAQISVDHFRSRDVGTTPLHREWLDPASHDQRSGVGRRTLGYFHHLDAIFGPYSPDEPNLPSHYRSLSKVKAKLSGRLVKIGQLPPTLLHDTLLDWLHANEFEPMPIQQSVPSRRMLVRLPGSQHISSWLTLLGSEDEAARLVRLLHRNPQAHLGEGAHTTCRIVH